MNLHVLRDASEVVHYKDPGVPLYAGVGHLSSFANMEMICHWHEDAEYIKAVKGHMVYYINGKKIVLNEGDSVLINSKQMHYGYSEDGSDCEYHCLLFRPGMLSGNDEIIRKYISPITGNPGVLFWNTGETPELSRLLDTAFEKLMDNSPCGDMEASGILAVLWARLYQNTRVESTSGDNDLKIMKAMAEYIYGNYASKLSLQSVAKAGGVCVSRCCRIFKKVLNKSPIEYINAYRIEVGSGLLSGTDSSITEIAYSCGFSGSSYFSETFMKYKGCTPGEYRRSQALRHN